MIASRGDYYVQRNAATQPFELIMTIYDVERRRTIRLQKLRHEPIDKRCRIGDDSSGDGGLDKGEDGEMREVRKLLAFSCHNPENLFRPCFFLKKLTGFHTKTYRLFAKAN